tara:strand:- start:883 stop:1395 length:513 start_codon:yes stop_codon:yes gene_type:complete
MPPKKKTNDKVSKKNTKKVETPTEESEENSSINLSEEENLSDDIKIDSETEVEECDIEKIIDDDNEFFNNDDSIEIQTDNTEKLIFGKDRKTNPRLTKYEMVRILGERIKQLNMGAKPLVKNANDISYSDVAMEELKNNMIPFKIKRPLFDNKFEIWDLNELSKSHLLSN